MTRETTVLPTRVSPSVIARRLESSSRVLNEILDGLAGTPFQWGDGERRAYTQKAAALGVTLVTRTTLKIKGYALKRGARPVGRAYFAAPISRYADLYVLECHCRSADGPEAPAPAPPADAAALETEALETEAEETWSLLLTNAEAESLALMLGYGQPEGFSQDDLTAVILWAEASRMDAGCLESVLNANMAVSVINGEVAFKTTPQGRQEIQRQIGTPQTLGAEPGDGKGTLLDTRA